METKENTAILSFNHIGSGLASLDGKPLRGFYLSADGRNFIPGKNESNEPSISHDHD